MLRVAKTARLCSGTSTTTSTCTRSIRVISSTLFASRLTDTGCALPPPIPLRFGIWSTKSLLTSLKPRLPSQRSTLSHNACRSPGRPMVKLSTLATPIMSSESGKLHKRPDKREKTRKKKPKYLFSVFGEEKINIDEFRSI